MKVEDISSRAIISTASGLIYWGGVYIKARLARRSGRSPKTSPSNLKEKTLWILWAIVAVLWIGLPVISLGADLSRIGLTTLLFSPPPIFYGSTLIVLGYIGTLWCYHEMGSSWKIGIDPEGETVLVTTGPYRYVRHPIYLFQMIMLWGVFLLLPLSGLGIGILIQFTSAVIKARDEERFLTDKLGEQYMMYKRKTGMFFPGL